MKTNRALQNVGIHREDINAHKLYTLMYSDDIMETKT